MYAGELVYAADIDKKNPYNHLWIYDLNSELLVGYDGPELVISSVNYGNETR